MSLVTRSLSSYRASRSWYQEFRTDLRVIFRQCYRGGWTLVVVCSAGGFWIGVILKGLVG